MASLGIVRFRWTALGLVGVALTATACATTRVPASDVPPLTIAFPFPRDSARSLLLAAMQAERIPIDGGGDAPGSTVSSTYTVRRGGIGESSIRLRFVIEPDEAGTTLIMLEAIATDRVRSIVMTGDRSQPAQRPEPRAVPASDLDALRPVQRLLRRLESSGGRVSHTP